LILANRRLALVLNVKDPAKIYMGPSEKRRINRVWRLQRSAVRRRQRDKPLEEFHGVIGIAIEDGDNGHAVNGARLVRILLEDFFECGLGICRLFKGNGSIAVTKQPALIVFGGPGLSEVVLLRRRSLRRRESDALQAFLLGIDVDAGDLVGVIVLHSGFRFFKFHQLLNEGAGKDEA